MLPLRLTAALAALIQNAAHLAVTFGRAFAMAHTRAFFLSRARSHPRDEIRNTVQRVPEDSVPNQKGSGRRVQQGGRTSRPL